MIEKVTVSNKSRTILITLTLSGLVVSVVFGVVSNVPARKPSPSRMVPGLHLAAKPYVEIGLCTLLPHEPTHNPPKFFN